MSARPDLRPEDAPDRAPEDLERAPQDIEELFPAVEDVDDGPTDIPELESQGFLPPPDAPRGPSLVEQRVRDSGFVMLDTEDVIERGQQLADAGQRHEVTEEAINTWRERADARRAAYARAELEAERRRSILGRGVLTGLMLGLFMAWGVTEIILNTDDVPATADAPEASEGTVEVAQAGLITTPKAVAAPEAQPEVTAEPPSFDPDLVDGRFKTWRMDDHNWWQFDFNGAEPLHLRWIAPDGNVKLEGWVCDNRITADVGRCYVGQHLAHFAPEPGLWGLYACQDAQASACALVDEFTIEDGLTVRF